MDSKPLPFFTSILALAFCAASCLSQNFAEADAILELNKSQLTFLSGNEISGVGIQDEVTDTLLVRSNRTWSITVTPESAENWLTLSDKEHLDPAQVSVEVPLKITCLRNKETQARTASIRFSSADFERTVLVEQKALTPEIRITGIKDKTLKKDINPTRISALADTCYVQFECNTKWTAEIAAGASATVHIDKNSGEDSDMIAVAFAQNYDMRNSKSACLVLDTGASAKVEVNFTQRKASPLVIVPDSYSRTRPTLERNFTIPLIVVGNWTAEIDPEQTTFIDPALSISGGSEDVKEIVFSCTHGRNPGVTAKAVIHFHSIPDETGQHEDYDLTLTQKGSLHLDFDDVKTFNSTSPYTHCFAREFSYPCKTVPNTTENKTSEIGVTTSTSYPCWAATRRDFITKTEGLSVPEFKVPVFATKGFWAGTTKTCMIFHANSSSGLAYIAAPALPGLTLKSIIWEPSFCVTAFNARVTEADENGKVLSGGSDWKGSGKDGNKPSVENQEYFEFTLEGTKQETEYWLRNGKSCSCLYVKEIAFIYE